eukprot:Polyplicarium_translucidae@DN3130_c0_g1_i3.p3
MNLDWVRFGTCNALGYVHADRNEWVDLEAKATPEISAHRETCEEPVARCVVWDFARAMRRPSGSVIPLWCMRMAYTSSVDTKGPRGFPISGVEDMKDLFETEVADTAVFHAVRLRACSSSQT